MALWSPKRLFLAYHAVDPNWRDRSLSVEPRVFATHMRRLAERGYRGLTFSEAVLGDHPGRTVSITFDAYPSVLEHALPVLRELGWSATVFAPTATVTSGDLMPWLSREFAAEKRQLTWRELTKLAEAGWEIGSHSRTHRLLSRLDDGELQEELESSRAEILQEIGSCTSIGYPWGEVDSRVVDASRNAGYTAGSGLADRIVHDDPLRTPRQLIAGIDGRIRVALKTSGLRWTLRSTPIWGALEAARGLDGGRDNAPHGLRARLQSLLQLR